MSTDTCCSAIPSSCLPACASELRDTLARMKWGLVIAACGACTFGDRQPDAAELMTFNLPPTPCAVLEQRLLGLVHDCPFELDYALDDAVDATGWILTI